MMMSCYRSELYDVLVNAESKEIVIAPHAKGLFCYTYFLFFF